MPRFPFPHFLISSFPLRVLAAAALVSGAVALAGSGARAGAPETVFQCRFTERPVTIDGSGGEAAWKQAPVIDGFRQHWAGTKARATTRARLLWDRENLYFLADMDDADLFADLREHDAKTWLNDVFELFFKPADDKPGYYEFQVNAANTVMDMFLPSREGGGFDKFIADGDFHIEAKVSLRGTLNQRDDRDRGWTVEGKIPWRDFLRSGGRPAVGEQWKFALCRYDYTKGREPEISSCAPLTKPSFHRWEDYAALRFEGPEKSSHRPFGIEKRVALNTSTVVGSPDPPAPYRPRRLYPALKLNNPMWVVHQPGSNRMLAIVQRWGGGPSRVLSFRDDPSVEATEEILSQDRCIYEICFHPDFQRNGYVYISSKGPLAAERAGRKMQVARYTMGRTPPYALDLKSEKIIIDWPSDGHDGAAMCFGKDGMFYVTTGDGTSDSDVDIVGQEMSLLTAKLLRIDVDHPDPGRGYSVPKDNPFVGMKDVRPETWAYGFRNPWRMTADEKTGHIWVGNNGQDLWETAYLIQRGANYGWSVYEGSHPFYPNRKLGPTPLVQPTVEHPHSEARSLTGGIVYYGKRHPELVGAYIYGDYSTGKIWAIRHDGTKAVWHREIADTSLQITGFAPAADGEIMIVDMRDRDQGGVYTLDPTPKEVLEARSTFPTRLSDSGLFRSVRGHVVQPGLIPFSVNAPLWSDGAHKERFIALPGADTKIDYTSSRGWSFPDRTVLVKSFALETKEGDPRSRRWIETRFLTKQDGEWAGYSYAWNDAQTEAILVAGKGLDKELSVRVPRSGQYPEGVRKQTWRYPSRAECMVCHSRAANFVLGPSLLQMNREHDYGGVRDNQLRVLEHLGVLRVDWAAEAQEALRSETRARGLDSDKIEEYVRKQSARGGQREPASAALLAAAPERLPRLVDPADPTAALDARARSYIHANCSQCHVEAGGGNAQIQLEFTAAVKDMKLFDVKPLHDTFGLPNARLVMPGSPERSVLLHRISIREKGQMPPLASSLVDRQAVELMRQWVRSIRSN